MRYLFCSTACCWNSRNSDRHDQTYARGVANSRTMHATRPPAWLVLATAIAVLAFFATPAVAAPASGPAAVQPIYVFGIPIDFLLFALTLLGVALFHHKTLEVALTGLAAIVTLGIK